MGLPIKFSLKLFLTLGVIALTICGSVSIGIFWYARTSVNRATEALVEDVESVATAQSLLQNLSAHRRQALLKGLRTDEERKNNIIISDQSLNRDIVKISNYSSTDEEIQMIGRVKSSVLFYLQTYKSLRSAGARSGSLYRQLTDVYDQAQQNIQALIKLNLDQTARIEGELNRHSRSYELFISIAILVFSLVVLGLVFGLRQILYRPFFRLKNQIDLFESSEPLLVLGIGGVLEIQEIALSFKNLSERLIHQKNQRLTFLASIAHDLRNPLGAIKISAEILQEDDSELPQEKKKVLQIIARQTGHLERLVEDLLDTTRIESGQFKVNLRPFDLRRTVLDSIALHSQLSSRHFFRDEISEAPVNVMADEQRISQVLNNLLSNAIKYSPNGGEISVCVFTEFGHAVCEVTDHGIGISTEDLKGIFEPFRRSSQTRDLIPGVGLGLSVARKIMAAHHGTLDVQSERNSGSTFRLKFLLLETSNPSLNPAQTLDI